MNEIYIVDGVEYNVGPNRKEEFLKKFPNAQLDQPTPGKTQPTTQKGAEPVDVMQAPELTITESPSVDFSLESPQTGTADSTLITQEEINREAAEDAAAAERVASLSAKESLSNALASLKLDTSRIGEFYSGESASLDIASASIAQGVFGKEAVDAYVAKYGEDSFLTEGVGSNELLEAIPKFKEQQARRKETLPIIESFKQGEIVKGLAASLGSGINALGSIIYGAGTLGSGYFMDFLAENYVDYNEGKAKRLDTDINTLIQEDKADVGAPLAIAGIQSGLEFFAFGKMTGALTRNVRNTIGKKSIVADILSTGESEAITEVLQYGSTEANKVLGETGSKLKAAAEFLSAITSQEGLESGVQGFLGGAGIKGSRYALKAANSLRAPVDQEAIENDVKEYSSLNQQLENAKDDTVREGIQKSIDEVKERIKNRIIKSNSIIPNFSNKDIDEVTNMNELATLQLGRVKTLNKKLEDGKISRKEHNTALEGYKKTYITAKNRIEGVKERVEDRSNKEAKKVNELYEEKGKKGIAEILELYRPMAKRIASKYRNVPGFDMELMTDEILTGERGILDLINSYKPETNVPLSAYVNKFASTRGIEAAQRNLKEDFELDVTEAKSVTDTTTEETTEQVKSPVEVQKLLSDELKLSDETSSRVLEAVEKTLGTKLPPVDSKDFKNKLRTGFRNELVNVFKQEAGKGAKYNEFISDVYDKLLPLIPQETLNRKLPFAVEPVLDSKTGKQKREKTKEGKKIFKRKGIPKAEFIKYFTDTSLKGNVKGARKTSLAEILADEIGMDKVLPVLSKPEVFERFKQVQELQGQKVPENVFEILSEKIDRLIQSIENFQKSDVARASLGIIEITANATVVMLKTIRAAIKAGTSISNAIRQGIEKAREILSKDLTDPNVEIVIDVLSSEITEETIQNISESEIKRIITTLSEDYDLTDKGADFLTEVKKEFPELSEILNNKEYLLRRTVKGQKIFNKELGDKTAAQTKLIIESLPKELHNINSTGVFGEMFGLHMRYLDTAKLKKSTGKSGLYYDTFKKENLNILSLNSLKNNLSDNAFKAFSDIDFSKIELQNISKGSKSTDFIKKVAKIAAQNTTKENKQLQVDKLYDAAIGNENKKLARALAIHLKDLYQSKKINDTYLLTILQGQTNLALGFRALTGPLGFELKDGAQDTSKWKGEHLKSSSEFNFQLLKWIKNSDSTVEELTRITNDFNQVFGDKSIFDIIDEKLGKTSTLQLERFTKSLSESQLSDFYIPSNQSNILQYAIDQNKAKYTPSKNLDTEFNRLLQATTGVEYYKEFSPAKARLVGRGKGKRKFFIPYSADDFVGLLYATLGEGKVGDKQMAWYEENLLRPFSRGIQRYEVAKQKAMREWMALSSQIKKDVPGGLNKRNDTGFRNQDSLRMYIWAKQGMDVPGTAKSDVSDAVALVSNNPKLKEFAERLIALNPEGYPAPGQSWDAGDITTDIVSYVNDVRRGEFLTEWKQNVDQIFTDKNKQKLLASYGQNYIDALEDILHRMKTGRNRKFGTTKAERAFMDWTNNSVGAIMFFNARSAVLQTLSAVNFINFSDNNPINAGLAFANQPQYWKDFSTLFNSDFLKQRRSGLQTDVNADEIANAAKSSSNKAKAALSAILKLGFTPTQIADSFAIASGGATFYRNRVKKYIKDGLDKEAAEKKAFTDFQEVAEETQQSARPDRISSQQASSLGRLVLAFGNTPMQYARLTKKASLDLINGRGDWKTNISKIAYYSVIQNIIFSSLQQGLFALLFDEEDDEKEKSRYFRIGNSSFDTLLRGAGVYGAAAATVKNMVLEIIEQSEKSRPDYTKVAMEATALSPPINSKLRKLESAGKTFTYKQSKEKVFTEGFSFENPGFLAAGKTISALTNLPADRVVQKADHIHTAMQDETELWQAIALSLGWSEWDLNMIEKQTKKSKNPLKVIKRIERKAKKY